MPPKASKKRKIQEDSDDSAPKMPPGTTTRAKRKTSSSDSEPALTNSSKAPQCRMKGEATVDKKLAKGKNTIDGPQYQSRGDWEKAWGKSFRPDILDALWDTQQKSSVPSDGSVFVVSYHRSSQYLDPEAKVLGVYTTASAANEHARGFLIDEAGIDAESLVGPEEGSAFWSSFDSSGLAGDASYWDVDTAGCWHLHGDLYKWGSFDLHVESKVVGRGPPARKKRGE